MTLSKLIQRYPNNPYVQSRMGRLCLEAGRKQEAVDCFTTIQKLLPKRSGDPLEAVSGGDADLEVTCLLNKGFMSVYDGDYKGAIESFRKVLTIKPANMIAVNNSATCQM